MEATPIWWHIVGFFPTYEAALAVATAPDWASKNAEVLHIPDATGDKYAVAYDPAVDR